MPEAVLKDFTAASLPLQMNGRWPGRYPQWREPGMNARPVMKRGRAELGSEAGQLTVASYTVPEGFRFVFTGLVFEFIGSGWIEGGPDLILNVKIESPSGERPVQYLQDIRTELGSRKDGPYPIPALVQLNNSNRLVALLDDSGSIGPGNRVVVHLDGYEFPESEAAF